MARIWVRRGVAVAGALASFGGCYWGLMAASPKMGTGVALGWSALPRTVVLGVLLAWAERTRSEEGVEEIRAVNIADSPGLHAIGNSTRMIIRARTVSLGSIVSGDLTERASH